MKDNYTRIAIILDRSGSMHQVREATVTGFNEFIRQQKKLPGECKVKLVQFDDVYEDVFDKALNEVPELTQDTFVPRGSTALLDAQGRTIIALGRELEAQPEDQRPARVVVVTLTDGLENASSDFKPLPPDKDGKPDPLDGRKRLADMIQHQRDVYKWDFVYLGANQDAIKTAAAMNIPMASSMTYAANSRGMAATMSAVSNYVGSVRMNRSAAFSTEERSKAMAEDDQTNQQPEKTQVVW